MNDGQKRRHIRDIAHLYLSGARQREPAFHLCVVMAGESRCGFPGFHAANLAAALAARGCEVRLHERSGLLPNAGFYLALPPSRYVPWDNADSEPGPGLSGVTVDFSSGTAGAFYAESRRGQVDFFHLPPLSADNPVGECFAHRENTPRSSVILLFAGGEGPWTGVTARILGRLVPDAVMVLRTGGSGAPGREAACPLVDGQGTTNGGGGSSCEDDRPFREIGTVIGWETALADRVPVVVRAPDSGLAGAYLAAADALRFKTDELRRTIVEPASAEGSDGLRPGSVDRRPGGEGTVLPISRFGARHSR